MSVRTYQPLADALALPPLAPPFKEGWQADRAVIRPVARTTPHDEQSSSTILSTPPLASPFPEGWQSERFRLQPLARTTPHEEPSSGTILATPPLTPPFREGWQAERFRLQPLTRTTPHDEQSSGTILSTPPLAPAFKEGWQAHNVKPGKPTTSLASDVPLIFRFVATPLSFPEGWYAESYRRPPAPTRQPADIGPAAAVILAVPPLAPPFKEGWYAERSRPFPVSPVRRADEFVFPVFPPLFVSPEGWRSERFRLFPITRTTTHDEQASNTLLKTPPLAPPFPEGWYAHRATVFPLSRTITHDEPSSATIFQVPASLLIPDFVFVEPTRSLVFSLIAQPYPPTYPSAIMPGVGQLGIDTLGNGEQVVAAWDAKNLPEILDGGTLLSSPAPTIQQSAVSGQPALTFTSIQVSGTQIQAVVSVTGGTAGTKYPTLAKVFINNASTWRYIYGDIVLIGPN